WPVQYRAARHQPLPPDRGNRDRLRLPLRRDRHRGGRRQRTRSLIVGPARRLGDAMGLAVDWHAVGQLDDEMLVNAIAQVAPFDVGAKQALLEQPTLPT